MRFCARRSGNRSGADRGSAGVHASERTGAEAWTAPARDLISERTREGLGRPKGSLGVSRLDGKEDEIRRFLKLGVSKTAIAKLTGVSRTALYSFMNTRGLRPSR